MDNQPVKKVTPSFWQEAGQFWSAMPHRHLFLVALCAWLALFHFLGNAVLGYINTPSLFMWLIGIYETNPDDQHGYLIPFVVAVVLWMRREKLVQLEKDVWLPALGLIFLALVLHVVGYLVQQTRVSVAAFFLGLYGLAGLLWGWRFLKATFFPFFLFGFCIPVAAISDPITVPLRLLSTKITSLVAHLIGINVVQVGNHLIEPQGRYQYEVAAACSGIRSLISLLAITTIYAFLQFNGWWRRLVMMFLAFPLSVIGNVVRLMLIVIAGELGGQDSGNYVHESLWGSLLPYVPAMLLIFTLGAWMQERPAAAKKEAA